MKTPLYIATGLSNAAQAKLLYSLIESRFALTYDWTVHGSVQSDGDARIQQVAINEVDGVLNADIVVVLLPGGRGTHTELGIALGAGKPVFLCAEDDAGFLDESGRTCAFYLHPAVRRCVGSIEVIARALVGASVMASRCL